MNYKRVQEIIDHVRLCRCATASHWECMLELLAEAENHTEKEGFSRDSWFEFGAKVLDGWNLLEHGSSISYAWLTEDGELLLHFLKLHGTEDDEWPEWIMHAPSCDCEECTAVVVKEPTKQ